MCFSPTEAPTRANCKFKHVHVDHESAHTYTLSVLAWQSRSTLVSPIRKGYSFLLPSADAINRNVMLIASFLGMFYFSTWLGRDMVFHTASVAREGCRDRYFKSRV